jgi:predicted ATPase/DNA-binding SARP family transcriptional activator
MSPRLALHLLGPPQLYLEKRSISFTRRKSLALLAYLAIERGPHRRESLSSLLWPDTNQSSAFKNLRQVLWEIQQILGDGWLVTDREMVCLDEHADLWLDVREFDSLIMQSEVQEEVSLRLPILEGAAGLYRHHFLAGFSLKDAQPFNDWAFAESEELRRKLAGILRRLSEEYCTLGQARQAIPHARRLVSLDPLDESAHRLLMEVYMQAGENGAALKQYQVCEQILRKELNLDPQPETREFYKRIRKGDVRPVPVEKRTETAFPRHNLPHQLSTFLGRQKEQKEIVTLFGRRRLVTLVGAGGIGKTSLSLRVGQQLLKEFPNGVWFIALDSLADPELITQTVAAIFDLREGGNRLLLDKLIDSLRDKTTLLLFDNCEHLLDACTGLIDTLLAQCPDLKVLATSRESLGVQGEAIYTMPSLPLPEADGESLEVLTEFESIQLFAERATLVLPSFQLTQENIQAVVNICRKVDGIPLAIELAAARVNILQVDEILEQLQESFALLSSDSRTILPRQQTIRGSMDWSCGLLSEAEKSLLHQLSVFAGGWTLDAAQLVSDGDALGLLSALVKKSLIVVDQKPGRGTRYRFHEMVRQCAYEQLVRSGEELKVRSLHLRYFVDLADLAQFELRGSSRVDWLERLNDERNNLRAALHWAEQTNTEAGLLLAGRLVQYWEIANLPEGRHWLELFLSRPASKDYSHARAIALHAHAWLLTWLQDFDQAYSAAEESLALFRSLGDQPGEVDALILLENILQFKGRLDKAMETGKEALALAGSLDDHWRQANALYYLGWGYTDFLRRFDYWETAILLYRKTGDQIALANILGLLAQFRAQNGDIELAETLMEEALKFWEANERANIWGNPKIAKSMIHTLRGEYEQASVLLQEIIVTAQETGNSMSQLWAEVRLGHITLKAGDLVEAQKLLIQAARDFHRNQYWIGAVFALECLTGIFVATDRPEPAARLIGWADEIRVGFNDARPHIEQADVDTIVAACIDRLGETRFKSVYEDGKKMTLDEAVAFGEKSLLPPVARVQRKPDNPKRQARDRGAPGEECQKEG